MDDSNPLPEIAASSASYFDRVLERCRSYRKSLEHIRVDMDNRIERIVAEDGQTTLTDLVDASRNLTVKLPPEPRIDLITAGRDGRKCDSGGQIDVPLPSLQSTVETRSVAPPQSTGLNKHLRTILTQAYVLGGRYELIKSVATTNCGVVFKALDRRKLLFDDPIPYVSVEVLTDRFQEHANWQVKLQREATRLNGITHPNIMPIVDFQRDGAVVFVVMEYFKGLALSDKLHAATGVRIPRGLAFQFIESIGKAVAYCHDRGILHGDLRPSCVLVDKSNSARVFDFALGGMLATLRNAPHLQSPYASPESSDQGSCLRHLDDVYAFSCLCYELLTGTHPFDWRSAIEAQCSGLEVPRRDGLTWTQWKVLQAGLHFDPKRRLQSIAGLVSDLIGWRLPVMSFSRMAGRSSMDWLLSQYRTRITDTEGNQDNSVARLGGAKSQPPALEHLRATRSEPVMQDHAEP